MEIRREFYHSFFMTQSTIEFLDNWYESEAGRRFCGQLEQLFAPKLEARFGYFAVQLGGEWLGKRLLDLSPVSSRFRLGRDEQADALCDITTLPIESDSVDLVILPHALCRAQDFYATLREVDRVLVAEGQLMIIEMDPWTLWGTWQRWRRPESRYYSQMRVKEALGVLGFQTMACDTVPMLGADWSRFFRGWPKSAKLFDLLVAHFRGSYVLSATKKVVRLTPLKKRWSSRPRLIQGGMAEPAARGLKHVRD